VQATPFGLHGVRGFCAVQRRTEGQQGATGGTTRKKQTKDKKSPPRDFGNFYLRILGFSCFFSPGGSIHIASLFHSFRFDWAMKRLLRNKANHVVLEGFLSLLLEQDIKIQKFLHRYARRRAAAAL
jgi:hypothetical protein